MGVRQSFGLFLQPISDDMGFGREVFSLALALQNLLFGLPLLGMAADRFGSRWVIFAGAIVYAAGCLLVPLTEAPLDLYLKVGQRLNSIPASSSPSSTGSTSTMASSSHFVT